jgi:thioredoxin reductase
MYDHDVIVIGGGPAGLSAALMLGRCRRSVVVFDKGTPRNARSHGLHGYPTRNGILPSEFLSIAAGELHEHKIRIRRQEVRSAEKNKDGFKVTLASGKTVTSRKLLIATGVKDIIPPLKNIDDFYGSSVFHCPYCDAWEMRGKPLAVYGKGNKGVGLALTLQTWSRNISLFTDGLWSLKAKDKQALEKAGIKIYASKIISLEGKEGLLQRIVLADGTGVKCSAMFFSTGFEQQCSIVKDLDCHISSNGVVKTDKQSHTNIKGLYVAGDASVDMHFVVVAAAEGIKAAVAINKELQEEGHY